SGEGGGRWPSAISCRPGCRLSLIDGCWSATSGTVSIIDVCRRRGASLSIVDVRVRGVLSTEDRRSGDIGLPAPNVCGGGDIGSITKRLSDCRARGRRGAGGRISGGALSARRSAASSGKEPLVGDGAGDGGGGLLDGLEGAASTCSTPSRRTADGGGTLAI